MLREFKQIFIFTGLLILTGCISNRAVDILPEKEQSEFLISQGQKCWEKRHDTHQAQRAYLFWKRAAGLQRDNQELQLKLSRACHFMGHFVATEQTVKDSLFKEGLTAGRRALYLSDEFSAAFENATGDSALRQLSAISSAPPDLVPALYWWAANLGRYMAYKPAIQRIQHQEMVETTMHRILALEPDFYYGAAYRFFGALYARIPGVEMSRSADYFKLAIEKHPDFLGAYTLRAEFYQTKASNREQFHNDLMRVVNADPTILPDVMPENILEQEYAKRLLEREHLLFE